MTSALERAYAERRELYALHQIYLESPYTIKWLEQSVSVEKYTEKRKCKVLLGKILKAAKAYEHDLRMEKQEQLF